MKIKLLKDFIPAKVKNPELYLEDYAKDFISDTAQTMTAQTNFLENYFFDEDYYLDKKDYHQFRKYFSDNMNSSFPYVIIVKGNAGVGKTSFLTKGMYSIDDLKINENCVLYINFRHKDSVSPYDDLCLCIEEKFKNLFNMITEDLRLSYEEIEQDFTNKYSGYYNFLNSDVEKKTKLINKIVFYARALWDVYNVPFNLVIDNLDLCPRKYQGAIISNSIDFFEDLKSTAKSINNVKKKENRFNLIITLRPDTLPKVGESQGLVILDFPTPLVYTISINNFNKALKATSEKECYLNHNFELVLNEGIKIKSFKELAEFLFKTIDTTIKKSWSNYEETYSSKYMMMEFEEFHNRLTDKNIRRFNSFVINCLKTGGFLPLTKEYKNRKFKVYDYLRMLILGGYDKFPGNDKNDGEMFNPKSPFLFNLFDFVGNDMSDNKIILNYVIYIRILQFIDIRLGGAKRNPENEERIDIRDIIKSLSAYYEKKDIKIALKKMIFTRLLMETEIGSRNINIDDDWRDIKLKRINVDKVEYAQITCSYKSSAMFYLYNLLCEYEYIYQMALASYYIGELNPGFDNSHHGILHEERIVLYFLHSLFEIIKLNVKHYSDNGRLGDFVNCFIKNYQEDNITSGQQSMSGSHPWKRMISNYINVLKHKIKVAQNEIEKDKNNDVDLIDNKKKRCIELEKLKENAVCLRKKGNEYFSSLENKTE